MVTGKIPDKMLGLKKGCQWKWCYGMTDMLGELEMVVGCNIMVGVSFVVIRKWCEVLRHRLMWCGFVDKEIGWWGARSWRTIRKVLRSMKNGSRVTDKLYINRGCLALEDFLFFFLYSFSCVAKQVQL